MSRGADNGISVEKMWIKNGHENCPYFGNKNCYMYGFKTWKKSQTMVEGGFYGYKYHFTD